MSTKPVPQKNRLVVLDHLRGFFIVVIVIDHLARWPSLLSIFTGMGLLWVTAAEGFVIISGLLIGYVRGFKNSHEPLWNVSKKLWKRAGLLYVTAVIASLIYTALIWYVPLIGGSPSIPIDTYNWLELIIQVLTLQYTYVWVHFLALYALFLAASPLAIWLMRRGASWLVIILSLITLAIGWHLHIEVLQWQALFFIPSVAGFSLEKIQYYWQKRTRLTKNIIATSILTLTLLTIVLSAYFVLFVPIDNHTAHLLNNELFAKDTISLWRLALAFTWFVGLVCAFRLLHRHIHRYFGWLLLPFGTRSLSAYIIHGIAICIISFLVAASPSILINTLLGATCIILVWGLLKIPFVQKIIPR